jgi:glutathione S-transferase
MLKIYGNKQSGSAAKVHYAVELLGIPYEYKELDFQKDLKTPWYLKIHPAGKIPSIDDDGFILWESMAIVRYLADKKGSQYYPKDLKKRAMIDQWMDFCTIHVQGGVEKVVFNKVFAPMMKLPVNEQAMAEGFKEVDRFFPIVDKQLQEHGYIAGEMSIADLILLAIFDYTDLAKIDYVKYKNISAWVKKMRAMDFFKKVKSK